MVARAALILLSVASPGLLLGMMFGGAGLARWSAPTICLLPVLLILVGSRPSRSLLIGLLALWLMLSGSWLALDWISSSTDLGRASAAEPKAVMSLMLLGLGVGPLVLVGWLFARTFRSEGLAWHDGTNAPERAVE